MSSRALKFETPCQTLLLSYPDSRIILFLPIKVFGYSSFVHIHEQHRNKLDPKASKCIFLSYPLKKVTNVIHISLGNSIPLWISLFLITNHIIKNLTFRGRTKLYKNVIFGLILTNSFHLKLSLISQLYQNLA